MNMDYSRASKYVELALFPPETLVQIQEMVDKGIGKFQIAYAPQISNPDIVSRTYTAELNADKNVLYYNGFSVETKYVSHVDEKQWFPGRHRLTIDDADILLSDNTIPRSIHKEYTTRDGDTYSALIQLNFDQQTKNGNYPIVSVRDPERYLSSRLDDFMFTEVLDPEKKASKVESLAHGQDVIMTPINKELGTSVILRSNPLYLTIHIMDEKGMLQAHDLFRTEDARQRIVDKVAQRPQAREGQNQMSHPTAMEEQGEDTKKKTYRQVIPHDSSRRGRSK